MPSLQDAVQQQQNHTEQQKAVPDQSENTIVNIISQSIIPILIFSLIAYFLTK